MDMLNHRSDGQSNAVVDQNENGTYSCYAKRDIKAGEEVAGLHICIIPSHAQNHVMPRLAAGLNQHSSSLLPQAVSSARIPLPVYDFESSADTVQLTAPSPGSSDVLK